MKVWNLQCEQGHVFEGWFGSEDDFLTQQTQGLLECPQCGSRTIQRMLSAPHLNLGAASPAQPTSQKREATALMRAVYERVVQQVLEHTTDVGADFPEQARRMHHGELPEAPIRGQATPEETRELLDEGVDVLPLAIPAASRNRLQ